METNYDLTVADAPTPAAPLTTDRSQQIEIASGTRLSWQLCVFVIGIITTLVYLNSFQGVALFDDHLYLFQPFTRQFWTALLAPELLSRPLITLSLYLNYKISGTNLWSYHLFNLLVHLTASLALFGIVKRTLQLDCFKERYADKANLFGFLIALMWAVHPLHTQAVTYIIQRCESLMGMLYLLTVYFAIRSITAERKAKWYAAAILACAGGMLSKEVMVTAPIVVLLYDWMFLSASVKELAAKRWKLYSGLFATWSLLVITNLAAPVNKTAGFSVPSIAPLQYLKVEFSVLVYYLKLAFYPVGLCLDYAWLKTTTLGEMLPNAIFICLLLALTIYGVLRRQALAFPLAWFFIVLSLTSSIVPFDDPAFEHRMYLPLAGIISFTVFALHQLVVRLRRYPVMQIFPNPSSVRLATLVVVTAIVTTLGFLTARRNMDYHNALGMWFEVAQKRPHNIRALNNIGKVYLDRGEYDQAIAYIYEAYRYDPGYAFTLYNLGVAFTLKGDSENGRLFTLELLRIDPTYTNAHNTLGMLALSRNDIGEAKKEFLTLLDANPTHAAAHMNLGGVLMMEKNYTDAETHLRQAIQLDPDAADGYFNLGVLFLSSGRAAEAIPQFRQTARLSPQKPQVYFNLGLALAETNQFAEAAQAYRLELRLNDSPQALNQLAYILATTNDSALRNPQEAIQLAQRAVELLNGQNAIPLNTLAKAYAEAGRFPEAIQTAGKAMEIAAKTGNKEVSASAEACLRLYRAGRAN